MAAYLLAGRGLRPLDGPQQRDGGPEAIELAPAWTTDWITAEGRRKLREFGIAPPDGTRAVSTLTPIDVAGISPLRRARVAVACPREHPFEFAHIGLGRFVKTRIVAIQRGDAVDRIRPDRCREPGYPV